MRQVAFVVALLAGAAPAAADDASDDLFGITPKEPAKDVDPCRDPHLRWWCVSDDADPTPTAVRETLRPEHLWQLGVADGSWVTAAGRALGASVDPSGLGPAFAGASPLENRWLIDGHPVDAVGDGAPELRVPLAFFESIDVLSGGLPASARTSTGAVIDGHLRGGPRHRELTARVWLGAGASPRRRPAVPDLYDPLTLDLDPSARVHAVATAGEPIERSGRWKMWSFLGVGVEVDRDGATRTARRLRDDDGDGFYDRHDDRTLVTETIGARHVAQSSAMFPFVVRLGGGRGHHALAVTGIGAVGWDDRGAADGTRDATAITRSTVISDALVTWTSTWARTSLRVDAGWHHVSRTEHATSRALDDVVQIGTAYIPPPGDVPDDDVFAAACEDGAAGDPTPTLPSCPVPAGFYVRGGPGLLTDTEADRPTVTAELAREVDAGGTHRLAGGATMEDARLRVRRRFSGGSLERRLAEDAILTQTFVELGDGPGFDEDCDGESCRTLGASNLTYRTRSIAGWLEDRWRPVPGVTVQGGLRWESMEVGTDLRFRDQVAPRLGFAADPSGRGDARIHASWGRSFPILPAALGPSVSGDAAVLTRLAFAGGNAEALDRGEALAIDPAIEAPMVDEVVLGGEWLVAERLRVGATWRGRWLRRGLEDVMVDDELTFANPGLGGAAALRPLRRDAQDWMVWLGNSPAADLHVRLGYARSRQRGSWAGPFDPAEGATLHRSSFDGTTGNAEGRLPIDLPHRLFVETIAYHLIGHYQLTLGARFQVSSGRPVSALGGARGEVPLLPRGSYGRMPTTSAVVLHASLARGRFTLALDLLDVFHRRAAVAIDERWTTDDVRPIEGGDATDLLWLRTIDDARARLNPGYNVATRYQSPLSGRLSLGYEF